MCNCINEIPNKVKERFPVFNRRTVTKAKMHTVFLLDSEMGKMKESTFSEVELHLEGQKKTPTITINHTFCPFCGEKYTSENDS